MFTLNDFNIKDFVEDLFSRYDSSNIITPSKSTDVGILTYGKESVKFVSDLNYIYANNKPIISTYNDHWTAMPVFNELMMSLFKDNYKSLLK